MIGSKVKDLSDSQLINELKSRGYNVDSVIKEIDVSTIHGWIEYLKAINDKTDFNQEIISDIYYVINEHVREKQDYGYDEEDKHFQEIKDEVKEIVTEFELLRTYFGIKKKKDIEGIDFSKYKL